MTKTELIALAERVEAATGADKGLNAAIWRAVDPDNYIRWEAGARAMLNRDWDEPRRMVTINASAKAEARHYTASIDAALLLVPDGMPWSVNYPANDDGQRSCHGIRTKPSADVCGHFGCAATPALALTAAALRARATQEQ